jgi:hypothetical protein
MPQTRTRIAALTAPLLGALLAPVATAGTITSATDEAAVGVPGLTFGLWSAPAREDTRIDIRNDTLGVSTSDATVWGHAGNLSATQTGIADLALAVQDPLRRTIDVTRYTWRSDLTTTVALVQNTHEPLITPEPAPSITPEPSSIWTNIATPERVSMLLSLGTVAR